MGYLQNIVGLVSEFPEGVQRRVVREVLQILAEEAGRLENIDIQRGNAPQASTTTSSEELASAAARAVPRVSEEAYDQIRTQLAKRVRAGREYTHAELFALALRHGHPVKRTTFTQKVLTPMCSQGLLVWNEQRRGSRYRKP